MTYINYKYYTNINVYRGSTKLPLSNTNGWGLEFPSGGLVTMIPTQIDSYTWRANVIGFTGSSTVMSGEGLIRISIYTGVYNVATYVFDKSLSLSKAQQGPLLDWIKEWDGASTYVDTYKVISPKMFAGSKNGSTYTGVAMGRDVFGLGSNGIAGFYNSTKTFHIDAATGNCIFGNGDNSISYVANTGQINFGKNVALNWNSGYTNLIWRNYDSSDFFKLDPGYKYSLSQKLKSLNLNRILLRKQMKVAGWYSISFWYRLTTSSNFTFTAQINDHIAVTITETGIHDWRFASGSVYVNQYLTDQPYGFVDFETIPSGVDIYISDLMVVEGKNIPLTYSPPMTLINSDGIYTGSLHADQITAGQIGAARLVINETLNVGGNSSAGSYNGVISVKNDSNTEVVRLDRNGLYAIAGTIGGIVIASNQLSISGTSSKILVEASGTRFLRINNTEATLLSMRCDGNTAISIGSYSDGIALNILANAGSRAITSVGPHQFIQRDLGSQYDNNEIWNSPGALFSGQVSNYGTLPIKWGDGCLRSTITASKITTGRYRINHTLNHTDYIVVATPYYNSSTHGNSHTRVANIKSTYFELESINSDNGSFSDQYINFVVIGRNTSY